MKIDTSPSNFLERSAFVKLGNQDWLDRLRVAGKCVSSVMTMLETLVKEKTTMSLIELSEFAEAEILKQNCTATFKGYKGRGNLEFPAAVCISVNQALVHGVPTDFKLKDGDIISFDFGATYNGAIADSAITCIFGEPKSKDHLDLIDATNKALYAGINAVKIDSRIGAVGNAIYKYAKGRGYNVIEQYGGHGIFEGQAHSQPFIANKASPSDGVRFQKYFTGAIEPMLGRGSTKTTTGKDGWTVYSETIFAHAEHTVFLHEDGKVEIITERN